MIVLDSLHRIFLHRDPTTPAATIPDGIQLAPDMTIFPVAGYTFAVLSPDGERLGTFASEWRPIADLMIGDTVLVPLQHTSGVWIPVSIFSGGREPPVSRTRHRRYQPSRQVTFRKKF